ncbi:MAG: 4Fe-4S binding protein [Symploca sp. SIO2E6]|nr:4Fe-4S binding protein [Symploca sp. SIO2E6]
MISRVSEKTMHLVRWGLAIGWLVLIVSLFYDPISHHLTDPNNLQSPFRDHLISLASDPVQCIKVQGECLQEEAYQMGTRIFWGMVVPSAIMIVLVFGHETWRRICPLYFLSQIPRALGWPARLKINNNSWLVRNHLYLQFALLFIGLNCRILFINSARLVFGLFLLLTILSAITVVFLYGGRSWCHYVCPFGVVQMVFTGPRGLLDSQAHKAPAKSITQSMCRTVDQTTGKEKSACISCKSPCLDIDSERAYWNDLTKPGRKLVQYGYLGLVIGYFVYYGLYAGNFDYYFSGAWTHEENQLSGLLKPGFYILNEPIAIPKLLAVPLTLAFFVGMSYLICSQLEKVMRVYGKRHNPQISREQALHQLFSLCTFVAFNTFFIYGGRPEILRLPISLQLTFNALVVLVSSLWLYQTWGRNSQQYKTESLAHSFRRQLKKLSIDFSKFLEGRCLEQLKPEELYVLAKVLPNSTKLDRKQIYKGVLEEELEEKRIEPSQSLETLKPMRQKLNLNNEDHYAALTELSSEKPHLLYPRRPQLEYSAAREKSTIRTTLKRSQKEFPQLGRTQLRSKRDAGTRGRGDAEN